MTNFHTTLSIIILMECFFQFEKRGSQRKWISHFFVATSSIHIPYDVMLMLRKSRLHQRFILVLCSLHFLNNLLLHFTGKLMQLHCANFRISYHRLPNRFSDKIALAASIENISTGVSLQAVPYLDFVFFIWRILPFYSMLYVSSYVPEEISYFRFIIFWKWFFFKKSTHIFNTSKKLKNFFFDETETR